MEESKRRMARLLALSVAVLAVIAAYVMVMFNTQIVHGATYLQRSHTQIVRTSTVEAARGDITDRNGTVLATNRQTYTLTFDASLLPSDTDENECILRLINLCTDNGVAYTDNLPLSADAPFSYTTGALSDTQKSRFQSYLDDRKFDSNTMTAGELFDAMCADFSVDEHYSIADKRKIIAVRYELALRKLKNISSYIMADDVTVDLISMIKDGDYYGADIGTASARLYQTAYAAHLLGYVGAINPDEYADLKDTYSMDAQIGRDGAESAFESYLHGVNGTRIVNVNDEGKVTSELYSVDPKPGATVELTIDLPFQSKVEDLLAAKIEEMSAKDGIVRGGAAVVIQVGTGDVLALASYPTYDISTFSKNYNVLAADPAEPLFNRATMGTYAPGSTFKMVTATAGLDTGVITPSTHITDMGKYTYYKDYQPACWLWRQSRATHGAINVTEAIKVSCNYFFYDVGRQVGIETLDEYARAYGLGQKTGIEIAESPGILAGPEYSESVGSIWYDGNTLQAAIGQSDNLFTPIQLANYVATLVGGGNHYPAHLLKTVVSYDNSEILYQEDPQPTNTVELSPENRRAILQGMYELAHSGSVSSYFKDCVVDAGAKTGSAQTNNTVANGVFVAFAPYDDPQIALAVVIQKGGSGGALASTAVGILNAYFTEDEIGTVVIGEDTLLG